MVCPYVFSSHSEVQGLNRFLRFRRRIIAPAALINMGDRYLDGHRSGIGIPQDQAVRASSSLRLCVTV